MAEAHALKVLGDKTFTSAFAEGQNMSLDEALYLVLKSVEEEQSTILKSNNSKCKFFFTASNPTIYDS